MSKYRYEMGGIIRDTEIDFPYYTDEIIELLDEKDQRIAELEDKDWYEALIKQLEEQNERLINDKENSKKAIVDLTNTCDKWADDYKKLQERLERYKTWYIELAEDSKNKYNEMYEFCIEQLNQVEADILDYTDVYWRTFSKTQDIYILYDDLEDCLKEYIGKRIEKLREAIQK